MPMKMYDACKRRLPLELFPVEQQHAQPSNQLQTHRPIDSRTISGLGGENVIHNIEFIFGELTFHYQKITSMQIISLRNELFFCYKGVNSP